MGYWKMLPRRRSVQFMAALAGGVIVFALAYTLPAAAQQADQPAAAGGLDEIVVAARPNSVASVELMNSPQGGPPTDGGATVAAPKQPASGSQGFIGDWVGSDGR